MTDGSQTLSPAEETVDPGSLTRQDFEAWIDQDFIIPTDQMDPLALTLRAVVESPYNKGRPRAQGGEGYYLELSGPADRYFIQDTAPIRLPDGRVCPLFITNNGPRDGQMHYQIIFN
ncbi:DUF6916 family protein [Novosphingobium beihaiensis]|uniref:DUF6916 domain-containing protein n=1 Tax=Novosphingobium beihaiensis TaxID=2930389 RepID=A0ABT0BK00_9SPHN|nr:hypothetical protein [Novosphingobium beihaiensis]MCJ2185391.1 hypothetical protein [Novosphingobium beihaiensis]